MVFQIPHSEHQSAFNTPYVNKNIEMSRQLNHIRMNGSKRVKDPVCNTSSQQFYLTPTHPVTRVLVPTHCRCLNFPHIGRLGHVNNVNQLSTKTKKPNNGQKHKLHQTRNCDKNKTKNATRNIATIIVSQTRTPSPLSNHSLSSPKKHISSSMTSLVSLDPSSPHAFTTNNLETKRVRETMEQSSWVILIFLLISVIFLVIVLIYISQRTNMMKDGISNY